MTSERRQQLLTMLLPAIATLVIYSLVIRPPMKRLSSAKLKLNKTSAPSASQLLKLSNDTIVQSTEAKTLRRELDALQSKLYGLDGTLFKPLRRTQVVKEISTTIQKYGLTPIEQSPLDQLQVKGLVPQPIRRVFARLEAHTPPSSSRFWRFRFVGSFPNTLKLLSAIAGTDVRLTPITLTMTRQPEDKSILSWEMIFWI